MKRLFYPFVGILLSMLLSQLLPAQAPGYLGKRFSIDLTTGLAPAISGPTQNNKGYGLILGDNPEDEGLGLNYTFELSANVVTGRYYRISLTGSQYYTGIRTLMTSNSRFFNEALDQHENLHRLNVKTAGLRFHSHNRSKGSLAPIGNSFYWGLNLYFVNGEIIDRIITYDFQGGEILGHEPLFIDQNKRFLGLSMGWQKTAIYFDQLIVKAGLGIHIPLDVNMTAMIGREYSYLPGYSGFSPKTDNQVIFEAEAFRRLLLHGLMRLEVGVGYLLF